jgi:hypothetical protein
MEREAEKTLLVAARYLATDVEVRCFPELSSLEDADAAPLLDDEQALIVRNPDELNWSLEAGHDLREDDVVRCGQRGGYALASAGHSRAGDSGSRQKHREII